MRKNVVHIVFVLLIFISSCKESKKKNNVITENKTESTAVKVESDKVEITQRKDKIIEFYGALYSDNLLSINDLRYFFGSIYDEADRYLKKKSDLSDLEIRECYDNPKTCESSILNDLRDRKKLITFSLKKDEIIDLIKKSSESSSAIKIKFSNDNSVLFYFRNNTEYIDNIIINNNISFLAEYEE